MIHFNTDVVGVAPIDSSSRATIDLPLIFEESTTSWPPGMWNDGLGDAYRDTDIMFMGKPTYRLSLNNETNGNAPNPGRTPITSGVVFKRRINDGFTGSFGLDMWFRFTSTTNNGVNNPLFSLSIYNRTGTDSTNDPDVINNAYTGRLWLNQGGNNLDIIVSVLDGVATAAANAPNPLTGNIAVYTQVDVSHMQNGAGSHTFDPSANSGRVDRAGGWHYAYLEVDLKTKQYVACKIDGNPVVDISNYQMDNTTSTGAAMMHLSTEYSAITSTPRYMNIAQIRGWGQ